MTDMSPFPPLDAIVRNWTSMALAPQKLWQSINGGWSFGNVIINDSNSSAPQTEQAIVATESYGRQIGKLLEAVDALVRRQDDPTKEEARAFTAVTDLKTKIDGVKHHMAVARIGQLRGDLDLLRLSPRDEDRKQYRDCIAELRTLLAEAG